MITRGTTPYHSFVLPLSLDSISELYITYLQNDEVILDKSLSDDSVNLIEVESNLENASMEEILTEESEEKETKVTVHLTQEDTLKFTFYPAAEKNIAVIQIRVLTSDGEAYASNPIQERIFGVLKDGVISE
jgi:hypothetical protein